MGKFSRHAEQAQGHNNVDAPEVGHNAAVLGNLNYTIILSFAFVFILLKSCQRKASSATLLHSRLQMLGAWLLNFSILFTLIFSACMTLLSSKYTLSRHNIELLKVFEGTFTKSYRGYTLDLATVMIFSLKISEILLISSLFFLLATLVPQAGDAQGDLAVQKGVDTSVGSFSITWGICRIPLHLYLDAYRSVFEGHFAVFLFDLIALLEILTAGMFLLILRAKRSVLLLPKPRGDALLLSLTLISYGIFKYAVNLISLPFPATALGIQVLTSVQFSLEVGLFMLSAAFFVPAAEALEMPLSRISSSTNLACAPYSECNSEVVLIPPTVEFDDKGFKY